jgi:SAM-dependent methyltransferase
MDTDMTANTRDNRYGAIASEIYDLDKPPGKLRDTVFYLEALSGISGPVLEPACGSGRALVPLAEAGHRMAGFDSSPDMLDRARALCAGAGVTAELSLQTFADFRYPHGFGAIILPVGSFTLIGDASAARQALARFRESLLPGGLLLLDVPPLGALANVRDDRRSWTAANGDLLTLEGIRHVTDWIAQRAEYSIRYERWRDNRLVASELEPMVQRHWGVEEMRMALTLAGFADVSCTADYRFGNVPGPASRVITWRAIRPLA